MHQEIEARTGQARASRKAAASLNSQTIVADEPVRPLASWG